MVHGQLSEISKRAPAIEGSAMIDAAARKAYDGSRYRRRRRTGMCVACPCCKARKGKATCHACADKYAKRNIRRKIEVKFLVFKHYGNRCACCGSRDWRFFTIDHIYGDGNAHRRSIGRKSIYLWLVLNHFPNGFQILCAKCQFGKRMYGECPCSKSTSVPEPLKPAGGRRNVIR
jgi:hypothetical protein